eukprot:1847379-Pyramimonas_sp.AAC.1
MGCSGRRQQLLARGNAEDRHRQVRRLAVRLPGARSRGHREVRRYLENRHVHPRGARDGLVPRDPALAA